MSQENKHIDDQIRKKLLDAEVLPSASVWTSLEKELSKKRKMGIIIILPRLGYAAAILLLGFIAYYFLISDRNIVPIDNKLNLQVSNDSLASKRDSVYFANTEEAAIKDEESIASKPEISIQKKIAVISSPKTNNRSTIKDIRNILIAQSKPDELISLIDSSNYINSIAIRKPASPEQLFSLYKSGKNPLSLFKAIAIKRVYKNEELSVLLADNTRTPKAQAWSVGLSFSPTSVSRYTGTSTKDYSAMYDGASEAFNNTSRVVSEKDLPAYAGGINLVYNISDRWSFQSGIYYLKQGQRIENFSVLENSKNASNNSNSYFGNIVIDNSQALSESAPMADLVQLTDDITYTRFNANLVQQFELLEIPFLASYKIIDRKTILSLIAGINSGLIIGNQVFLSDNTSEAIGKTETINSLIYKSVIGFSLEYPIMRKFYFNFSPTIKYQLNNFNKNAIVGEQLQYFEFKTGVNYRF